jgi:hypothetical protein
MGKSATEAILVRVPATANEASKLLESDKLISGTDISHPNYMQVAGSLYMTACNWGSGTFCQMMRVKSSDLSSSPQSVSGGQGLNYTRVHTNQYPIVIHNDKVQNVIYFTSPTTYWSQLFRIDETKTYQSKVIAADVIESLVASGSNAFGVRAGSDTKDIHYLAAGSGTAGHYKLFRLKSNINSGSKLTTAQALTAINPGGSDGVAEATYDEDRGKLYFVGTRSSGSKLYRLTDETTGSAPIGPNDNLSDIVPGGDDKVASVKSVAERDVVLFVAEPTATNKKLFMLRAASTGNAVVQQVSNFVDGGNDNPVILLIDSTRDLVVVGINTSPTIRQLAVVPFAKLNADLDLGLYLIPAPDFPGGPDYISTATDVSSLFVRMIDAENSKTLHRLKLPTQ